MRNLLKLPKADLHCHLEGSARRSTVMELAKKYHIELERIDDFDDLPTFLATYKRTLKPVILSIDDLTRVASELVSDRADDGGVYCEPMWTPQNFTHLEGFESSEISERVEEVFARVNQAMLTVVQKRNMQVGHLIGVSKAHPEYAAEVARFAVEHQRDGVVSFGTYGNELLDHAPFAAAARIAIEGGLMYVPHAGEIRGPESVDEVIRQGAQRISHGVRAIESDQVCNTLSELRIACDIGLSSNLRLGVVEKLGDHPITRLIAKDIPVTLGTDDSFFFGSSLNNEYELARSIGLDDKALAKIAATSIRHSGLAGDWQEAALVNIDNWMRGSQPQV